MDASINMNDYVYVRLTDFGVNILYTSDNAVFARMNYYGVYQFQLHELMRIYAPYMTTFSPQVPFVDNKIILSDAFVSQPFEPVTITSHVPRRETNRVTWQPF